VLSFEFDCVVQQGENVPANPGPSVPRGSSTYARCGGAYPIALFVDRLVDALLQDERVAIPVDGQKRNDASLKYLFTEVMCNITGGPEIITAKDFDETKLLLPKGAWEIFIATAQVAADHFPATVRPQVIQCLQHNRGLIVDPKSDLSSAGRPGAQGSATVKTLQSAVAGRMLTSAAIAARHAAPGAHVDARRRVIGDPRTLYGRGGGVFGLAKLADNLMEAWMANPALNGNAAVAKWHESQQKFGFKFLVTQLLGYLTGGPQRYTGVSMEAAHKHLAITTAQWSSFMADAVRVFQGLGIDGSTEAELMTILASFKNQCVVQQGEVVPADPGMCRARPQGSQAYSSLGGVYPIALFADRLVDRVLQGDCVQVQWNHQDDTTGMRHPPGLKYMFTELLCHSAGGPELPTSKGFDEAKLGIAPAQWQDFLGLVAETASVWPTKHHRDMVLKICVQSKVEICMGLEGQSMPPVNSAELTAMTVSSSAADAFAASGRCPFSGKSGGQCPFTAGSQPSNPPVARSQSPRSPSQGFWGLSAELVRNATSSVASLLGGETRGAPMDVVGETTGAPMNGRILSNSLQEKLDELLDEDPDLCCPVSLMIFQNPVQASDGFIYEQASLLRLLADRQVSPMTREVLKKEYRMAKSKKAEVEVFLKERSSQLLDFAAETIQEKPQLARTALQRVSEYMEAGVLNKATAQSLAAKAICLYGQLGKEVPGALRLAAGGA